MTTPDELANQALEKGKLAFIAITLYFLTFVLLTTIDHKLGIAWLAWRIAHEIKEG